MAERDCLIELGYRPAEPPSFEKFVSDWRTGPWNPLEGVGSEATERAELGRRGLGVAFLDVAVTPIIPHPPVHPAENKPDDAVGLDPGS